jgi:hypothetical protein
MQVANFGANHGGEWAPYRRNLGSLFVCSKQKSRDLGEWSERKALIETNDARARVRQFDLWIGSQSPRTLERAPNGFYLRVI